MLINRILNKSIMVVLFFFSNKCMTVDVQLYACLSIGMLSKEFDDPKVCYSG